MLLICLWPCCFVLSAELPSGMTEAVIAVYDDYEEDLADVLAEGLERVEKERRSLQKNYEKLEKSLLNAGVLDGLRTVQARLGSLQGTTQKTLFGVDEEAEQALRYADLPSIAQRLEDAYEKDLAIVVRKTLAEMTSVRTAALKKFLKEQKRMVKKGFLDEAEDLQMYLDEMVEENLQARTEVFKEPSAVLIEPSSAPASTLQRRPGLVAQTQGARVAMTYPADYWGALNISWAQLNLKGPAGEIQRIGIKKEFMALYDAGTIDGLPFREHFKAHVPEGFSIVSLSVSINNGHKWADPSFVGGSLIYRADTVVLNDQARDQFLAFLASGKKGGLNIN